MEGGGLKIRLGTPTADIDTHLQSDIALTMYSDKEMVPFQRS